MEKSSMNRFCTKKEKYTRPGIVSSVKPGFFTLFQDVLHATQGR